MQKRARVSRGEMTFQDIYDADALLNEEDEEDDSDWEPLQQQMMPVEFVKWCCVNCTMSNPGDMVHCYVCCPSFFMFEYCFFLLLLSLPIVCLRVCAQCVLAKHH